MQAKRLEQNGFSFETAFSRNIGWITTDELQILRRKKVAIAGMGGVGGAYLLTMTRLGVGNFHVADFDSFEVHNFNRQAGAYLSTLGRTKVDVMEGMARDINPELKVKKFSEGVTAANLTTFFNGVDVYLDGLDFFAFAARRMVFRHCYENGIPIVTVGPVAMGGALLVFLPGKMSPEKYFDWQDSDTELEMSVKFVVGLTPSVPHRRQNVEPSALDFTTHRTPSTPMGVELCAGIAGTEAMKILLQRGKVHCAPRSIHFDAFENKLHSRWIWLGNRNPLQRLKITAALRQFRKRS